MMVNSIELLAERSCFGVWVKWNRLFYKGRLITLIKMKGAMEAQKRQFS